MPFLVHTILGIGFPLTFPSKYAFPPWANLAFLKICSKTGGDAVAAASPSIMATAAAIAPSSALPLVDLPVLLGGGGAGGSTTT